MSDPRKVLDVSGLRVEYKTEAGSVNAVDDVSFSLHAGECLGIVGQSGSGKSQTFLAIMGLLPRNGRALGSVKLDGDEILGLPNKQLSRIRGVRLGMVFQDPLTSLTPHMKVGKQLAEVLVRHERVPRSEALARSISAMERVQIADAERCARQYPHQLSGGMRQRVMIAMALLCRPDLLIADEATTGLDVTVQAEVLDILRNATSEAGTAIAFITHDLAVVAELCNRAIVLHDGKVVEAADVDTLFASPAHPHTRQLLNAMSQPVVGDRGETFNRMPGQPGHT